MPADHAQTIARQIVHTLATKGLSAAFRMALVVVLGRALTPADYGAYALIGTVATFGVLLVGLNLSSYLYRAVPGRAPAEQLGLFKATLLFELAAAAAVTGGIVATGLLPSILRWFNAEGYDGAFAAGLLLLVLQVALAEVMSFLQAQSRIEQANWVDLTSQASWVLPFVAWWALGLPAGVVAVVVAQVLGGGAALALASARVGIGAWWRAVPAWPELRPAIAFSVPMILSSITFYALKLADRFILSSHWGLAEVGLYSFAYTFVNMLYTFSAWAVFNAFIPRIIAAHNTGDYAQRDLLQTYMLKVSVAGFVLALAVFLASYDPIISALARPEYRSAIRPLPLLALSHFFMILAYPAGNMLFMQNRVKASAAIDLVGVAVGIAGNLLLIPRWSYMGAAVASALGFATVMVGKYAISGTLSSLRMDRLFSVANEAALVTAWYRTVRQPAERSDRA